MLAQALPALHRLRRGGGGARTRALALALAVACAALVARPACSQTAVTCSTSSWMYVAGFTGTAAATVNGWYAPYYNASLAPTGLQRCTNVGYNTLSALDPGWQTKGNPVGYFNVLINVSDPTNSFWVRLLRGARPTA